MPAVVMKINGVEVLEVYLPYCKLFFLLWFFFFFFCSSTEEEHRSVLVCQLSDFSDALGIPIFHYIKYKKCISTYKALLWPVPIYI